MEPLRCYTLKQNYTRDELVNLLACEQAPVGDSRVQSRANGMNRERSGEERVCRGACRHSIDAAVP